MVWRLTIRMAFSIRWLNIVLNFVSFSAVQLKIDGWWCEYTYFSPRFQLLGVIRHQIKYYKFTTFATFFQFFFLLYKIRSKINIFAAVLQNQRPPNWSPPTRRPLNTDPLTNNTTKSNFRQVKIEHEIWSQRS